MGQGGVGIRVLVRCCTECNMHQVHCFILVVGAQLVSKSRDKREQ